MRTTQYLFLIRHGQTTYNVEGRLPGQLPGVALNDEGKRQAQQAAVALSGLTLSAIVTSPLERARDTAAIIARGWALPVGEDARLMDTDVGAWAGQKISDVAKNDPRWKEFTEHPTQPPDGVESLAAVQQRAVAAIEAIRCDPSAGDYVVVVAHADVVKLIVAQYTGVHIDCIRYMAIGNASISTLAFTGDAPPTLHALNWTAIPRWLTPAPAHQHGTVSAPTEAMREPDAASGTPYPGDHADAGTQPSNA